MSTGVFGAANRRIGPRTADSILGRRTADLILGRRAADLILGRRAAVMARELGKPCFRYHPRPIGDGVDVDTRGRRV